MIMIRLLRVWQLLPLGAYPQDYISSYKEGYWGKIGAISLILPQFHAEILAGGGGGASAESSGDFGAASLAHLYFFASTTASSCNAARPLQPLRIHCASTISRG
jgi:hypothetical protein